MDFLHVDNFIGLSSLGGAAADRAAITKV